ncbi:MAG: flagellar FliJ family protein [Bacillota bacterium]
MKRFDFRLEPLLQYRTGLEKGALLEKVRAQEELSQCREVLEQTCNLLDRALDSARGEKFDPLDGLNNVLYREFLAGCKHRQELQVAGAETELERRRQMLVEARRDKLVLEKLKEKQFCSYRKELHNFEQKSNDELAMVTYANKFYRF